MRTFILAIIITLFAVPMAQAADQVLTITIPDQQVPRVVAAVNARLKCGELGPKACLKKELITEIRKLVRAHEAGQITQSADEEIGNLSDPQID